MSPHAFVWRNVKLGEHCLVISGFCNIGASCFFRVNSTVGNNLNVGAGLVGAGALILGDVDDGEKVVGTWKKRRPLKPCRNSHLLVFWRKCLPMSSKRRIRRMITFIILAALNVVSFNQINVVNSELSFNQIAACNASANGAT